jgi:hypothetical protein
MIWHEWWRVSKSLSWASFQALASCPYAAPRPLAHTLLFWSTCPEDAADVGRRGLSPNDLLYCLELLVCDARLMPSEAATMEEALLSHVSADGRWL